MHFVRVETGSGYPGHLGQPGHVLSRSNGSDPVYKISRSDPDSAGPDQSNKLSVLDSDDESVSLDYISKD